MTLDLTKTISAWTRRIRFPILLTPDVEAYGNCTDEIYWGLLLARQEERKIILDGKYTTTDQF